MISVAFLVNELTSTSIPVEIAAKIHQTECVSIQLVSYYDSAEDRIDPDIEERSVPIVRLGASKRVDVRAYRQLRSICSGENIDILHTHHNSTGSFARLAVAGTKTAIINTEHNDHQFFSHLQKVVNSMTYHLIYMNVSNSHSTAASFDWYERILFSGVNQEVVYNGIDRERIGKARECPISLPDGPKVVIVGSLIKQKNHKTLLRAFQSVKQRVPDASLIIVGQGPLSEELKQVAAELCIHDSVLFTGYLPRRDDVYSVLRECTLGVFPSLYEGFCVAAVEAMAVGLPVVVSDLKVLREVVGEPGIFADPNDPGEFADAMTKILLNQKKAQKLGRKAKQRAQSEFSLEETARRYCNIYKQVAEKYIP